MSISRHIVFWVYVEVTSWPMFLFLELHDLTMPSVF